MAPTSDAAAFSLAAFGVALTPVSAILLIKRRNCFPVSGRNLSLLLAQVVVNLYAIVQLAFIFIPGMPCAVAHWMTLVGIVHVTNFILVRAWDLTFRYGLTQELLQDNTHFSAREYSSRTSFNRALGSRSSLNSDSSNPPDPTKWYTNHSRLIDPYFLIIGTSIVSFTLAGAVGVAYTLVNPWILDFSKNVDPPCEPVSNHIMGVVLALAIVAVTLTAYRVKAVREGSILGSQKIERIQTLKRELFLASSTAAIILLSTYFGGRTMKSDSFLWIIWNVWFQWLTFLGPALYSYRYSPTPEGNAKGGPLLSFEQIVSDPRTIRAFESFLAKEFALENLYFHLACEQYKRICRNGFIHQMRRAARRIHDRFIEETGELSVNIAHKVRATIKEEFTREWHVDYCPPEGLFDDAQAEIIDIMKLHAVGRFLVSGEYETYLQEDPSLNLGNTTTALAFFSHELGRPTVDDRPPGYDLKIVPPDTPRSFATSIDGIGANALDSSREIHITGEPGIELKLLVPGTPSASQYDESFATKVDGIGATALDTPRQVRFTIDQGVELKLGQIPTIDSPRQIRLLEKLEKLELEERSSARVSDGGEMEVEIPPVYVD